MNPKDKAQLKFKLLNILLQEIYKHVNERLGNGIKSLLQQNMAFNGEIEDPKKPVDSFYYQGRRWSIKPFAVFGNRELHESLVEQAEELFNWYRPIEEVEIPLITGFIRKILNQSDDMAVVLPLLPGPLHGVIREATNAPAEMIGSMPAEEVARIVGASEKSWRAFNVRMMSNLIGA